MRPVDPRLLHEARSARPALAGVVLLGVTSTALIVAQAVLITGIVVGAFEDDRDAADLAGSLVLLAGIAVARAAVAWGTEWSALRASASVKSALRQRLVHRLVDREPGDDGLSTGHAVTLMTRGLDALDGYFSRYLPQLILAVIVPITVLACILPLDRVAFLTIALTLPLIPVFMALVGMATESSNRRRWDSLTRLGHHFLDVVQGLPTLKLFGRAKAQALTIRRITDDYRQATMATLRVAFLSSLVLELLATLSVALVAVGVGLRLVDGGLDLRTGLLVLVLAPEAYLPLRAVGAQYHASAEGLAAAERALAVIDRPSAPRGSDPVPDRISALAVDGLSVQQPGRGLLAPHNLSLRAECGSLIVVTGSSGHGKTTVVDVLLGRRRPTVGDAYVIDASGTRTRIADLDRDQWRRRIAWVPQHPSLGPGTVADNVRWGDPSATDDEVSRVLARVGLDGRDTTLPQGADTLLTNGSEVSVGQRRRIAVARALLRAPSVLLLDEPTAGLDADAEHHVIGALRDEALRGAIVVVVSHHTAVIDAADVVVTVDRRDAAPPSTDDAPDRSDRALVDARSEAMTP